MSTNKHFKELNRIIGELESGSKQSVYIGKIFEQTDLEFLRQERDTCSRSTATSCNTKEASNTLYNRMM